MSDFFTNNSNPKGCYIDVNLPDRKFYFDMWNIIGKCNYWNMWKFINIVGNSICCKKKEVKLFSFFYSIYAYNC